jgi:hypothetical protein
MEALLYTIYRYGLVFQILAIAHFIWRRPQIWWLLVILIGGPLGSLVYLIVEALPDLRGKREGHFKVRTLSTRQRRKEAETRVAQNPAPGNYEELADIYFEEGRFADARAAYDKAISVRTDSPDPFYRRALCELEMGDFAAALPDLEYVYTKDPKYDFHRVAGLLAHALARTGRPEEAEKMFQQAVAVSTAAETEYNYAEFLAGQGRTEEARQWTRSVLSRRETAPAFLRRRDRPWYERAAALLGRLG